MRRGQTWVICLLGVSLLVPAALAIADANGNIYQTIAVSNPFRLKPPPPPPDLTPPKEPASVVTLTGITTILGDKLALLEVQPPNNKPKIFLTLSEKQREGEVEVVSIDEINNVVRIKNQDIPQTLDFTSASKKMASAVPPPVTGNPTAVPNASVQGAGLGAIPQRNIRASSVPATGSTPTPGNAVGATTRIAPSTPATTQEKPLSVEDQIILMEINRELTKDDVAKGKLPPLPPTPLTPQEAPPSPLP